MDNPRRGITYLSLCSGYDGIGLGLKLAGVQIAFTIHVEIEAFASQNLANKIEAGAMGPGVLYPNVKTFPYERFRGGIDLLSAGFPCFSAGTLVLCEDGYRPIEDVQVGDSVLTHNGRWRSVTGIMQRPGASLRRIESYGCGDIFTTDEHPFYVRDRGYSYSNRKKVRTFSDPRWTEAKDLSSNSFVGQVLPPVGRNKYSADFWWLVGRYLAYGWTQFDKSQSCGRTIICCNKGETSELQRRISLAGFHASMSEERTTNKFHIAKKSLYDFLQPFGRCAHGKKLPKCALELPESKAKALIEGYISGDGRHASNPRGSGKKWRVGTVSERLAYGMSMLAHRAFGVCAQVRTYIPKRDCVIEGRRVNERIRYIVEIPERNRESFVDGNWGWKPVRRNESAGTGTVFNISVEEDESYIVNGAVVHNCQPFSHAGRGDADSDPRHLFPFIKRGIEACCPDWVLLENVDGIASRKLKSEGWADPPGTPVLLHVLRELERAGYQATWGTFSAAEVGCPHQRKRIFILAKRLGPGVQPLFEDDSAEPRFPISGLYMPARPGRGQWWWEPPRVLRGGEFANSKIMLRNGCNNYSGKLVGTEQISEFGNSCGKGMLQTPEKHQEMADSKHNGDGGKSGNNHEAQGTSYRGGETFRRYDKTGNSSPLGSTHAEAGGTERGTTGQVANSNGGGCRIGTEESNKEGRELGMSPESGGEFIGEDGECPTRPSRASGGSTAFPGGENTVSGQPGGSNEDSNGCGDAQSGVLASDVPSESGCGRGEGEAGIDQLADTNSAGQRQSDQAHADESSEQSDGSSVPRGREDQGMGDSNSTGQQAQRSESGAERSTGPSGEPSKLADTGLLGQTGAEQQTAGSVECSEGRSQESGKLADTKSRVAGEQKTGDRGQSPVGRSQEGRTIGCESEVQAGQEVRETVSEVGGDLDVPTGGMGYADLLESTISEATDRGYDDLVEVLERERYRINLSRDFDSRTDELRLLGNGVVPPCAAKAVTTLYKELT